MHVSRHEPRRKSTGAERSDHQDREIATTAAAEFKSPHRILNAVLMPRDMLEALPYGVRHADEKFMRADGSVSPEERRAPAIDFAARSRRLCETLQFEPILRSVGKWI